MPQEIENGTRTEEPFLEINTNEEEGGGPATFVFVISIILSVVITGFFIFYKYRTDSQVNDKQQALNSVLDQLHTPENMAIESKANDLNSSLRIINIASKTKYSFKGFMDELVKKITNDTKLNSLAISDAGFVTMDGRSSSYRSVADLAVALKSSSKLKDIEITGLTKGTESAKTSSVIFSMKAQIKDWDVASASSDSTSTSSSGTGGSSE
ncbi:MAG: PilN domain-containing protein [Candidatus Berkelbacteria bacterium]|nr:PilN domain-containing protein [Candidatus Berkelbacteria bacterium]